MTQILVPTIGSKVGFSANIGTSSFSTLSNATVLEPNSPGEQARVISTSANDTAAGIGIQKVIIIYFDNNWVLNKEIVTMNGTTEVLTIATNILHIDAFEAFQTGVGILAIGTVTLTSTDGTRLFAQIDIENTRFNRALHFVSPGKIADITDIVAECSTSGGVQFAIFITKDNTRDGGGLTFFADTAFILANDHMVIQFHVPIVCDASFSTQGLEIGIGVKGLAATQSAIATFHFEEN